MYERLLDILPGTEPDTRVELVQVSRPDKQPYLEVRQARYCDELGWRVEKRVQFGAGSVPQLREAINQMDLDARQPARAHVLAPHLKLVVSGEYDEAKVHSIS